ncbi:MAG: NADP(H)-dependent aldo-keto reductase [Bacteroidota bacterium]
MIYNKLGQNGPEVSVICLGTMTFGEQNTEAEAHQQLDYALANGVNFIDTAELYSTPARAETQGSTERYIGSWLAGRSDRADMVIATKIAGDRPFANHIRQPLGFNRNQLEEALEASLGRLQTNYVDLYQLHWPNRNTNFFSQRGFKFDPDERWEDDFLDVLESMQDIINSGRVLHWGLSNETPWGLMRVLHLADKHGLPRPVSIQNPYSLVNRTFEIGLAEICMREGVSCLPYSPLAFGRLSGKYLKGQDKPESRLNKFPGQWTRYNGDNTKEAIARYLAIAEKHDLSLTQMALAFVNDQAFVSSNIIGATTLEQLQENIASAEVHLSRAVLSDIERVHNTIPDPAP